jgi:hypothetical protein
LFMLVGIRSQQFLIISYYMLFNNHDLKRWLQNMMCSCKRRLWGSPRKKKHYRTNVLFFYMLVTIIGYIIGGVQDRMTRIKVLC